MRLENQLSLWQRLTSFPIKTINFDTDIVGIELNTYYLCFSKTKFPFEFVDAIALIFDHCRFFKKVYLTTKTFHTQIF